jgi:hypothetical protein
MHCVGWKTQPVSQEKRWSIFFYLSTALLLRIVGGCSQLCPLGTAATNRPIVPAPGDYDDEEIGGTMIDRGNRSTRRKPAQHCPPQTPHTLPGREPGPARWKASE